MCTPLEEYRTYLNKLVEAKSPLLFSNGGKDYASILMSILLKHTKKSIHMFCEGFKPDLIKSPEYWNALKKYLNQKGKELHVIVNSEDYVTEEPLKALFEEQKKREFDGTIQVRLISEKGRNMIKDQFNDALNNFAVFDDDMYRLEYDPQNYMAVGSFNQPNDVCLLQTLFKNVFEISNPLTSNGAIAS